MTPVDQTIFEDGRGDCLRACVASITGIPAEEIPNFSETGTYTAGAAAFLEKRGYRTLQIKFYGEGYDHQQFIQCLKDHCILAGWSPRYANGKRKQHAVVGHADGWSFVIDHDPHPSRLGIVGEPLSALWIFGPVVEASA